MDLTIIADLLSSINPIVLGGVAGGFLVAGGAGLYVKRNKSKFIENTDSFAQPNDFKTLKTEDLEREFGSLTVQTKMLDEDESLFFDKSPKDKMAEKELTQPSTKLVDEASVFDSFGKQDQAVEALKKAVDIEKYDKERVRLKIVLSQYNIKKGKVSLEEIIKEYPSFHAKVSFGPDNTLSALMGSPIPKADNNLHKTTNTAIDKEFDIFKDLPVLNETVKSTEQPVSYVYQQVNPFDDLPVLEETPKSTEHPVSYVSQQINPFDDLPVLEETPKSTEPVVSQVVQQHNIFDDLPVLEETPKSTEQPVSQVSQQQNLFDDLPVLEETHKPIEQPVSYVSQQINPFDDLPVLEETHKSTEPVVSQVEPQNNINHDLSILAGIFDNSQVVDETPKVTQQAVSQVSQQQNLFDDLPNIEDVHSSNHNDNGSPLFKSAENSLFEQQTEPVLQHSTQLSLFDDIPDLLHVEHKLQEEKTHTPSLVETSSIPNFTNNSVTNTPVDQFSWNSNTSTENDTEKMLQALQKDAEKIDQINEKEAMDDMQKFWQEFGNMVVDIKNEVNENHNIPKQNNITEDTQSDSLHVNNTSEQQDTPEANSQLPTLSAVTYKLPDYVMPEQVNTHVNQVTEQANNTTQQSVEDLEPPVLHDIIQAPSMPTSLPAVNYGASTIPALAVSQEPNPVPTPVVSQSVEKTAEIPPVAQTSVIEETPKQNVVTTESSTTQSPVIPEPSTPEAPVETLVKPQTFKVWANWIVNIEGQQVFRNHFINLKNPWGSVKAGEELYGGINRLSGKDINGKNYPWVLVSAFPLNKE